MSRDTEVDLPQSVPSPLPLDSGDVSISSGLDRKSKPLSASSVSGSSLVSMLAGVVVEEDDDFFLRIFSWKEQLLALEKRRNGRDSALRRKGSLTVLDSTLGRSRPSPPSSSSSSSLNSAAAFSMNLKASSTALVSDSSTFLSGVAGRCDWLAFPLTPS